MDKPVSVPDPTQLEPRWLSSVDALDAWLRADAAAPVALDSEFERTHTFYARPGLVQLAREGDAQLVEPEVIADSAEFRRFLVDPNRVKLLYALSEDADLFREWLGVELQGALDVQLAAAFAGHGMSVGFARLVEERLGIALDKSLTRSDWLARPLSLAQQQYALADVVYLLPLANQLRKEVAECGYEGAWQEESRRFVEGLADQLEPERYYLRLRHAWRLSDPRQRVLRALCQWREGRCRELDRPRNRVVGDKLLANIAEALPRDLRALGRVPEVPPVVVRKHGEVMLAVLSSALDDTTPLERIRAPLSRDQQAQYKRVKRLLQAALEKTPVPMELLAPRRKLEPAVQDALAEGGVPHFLTQGWRGELTAPVHQELEALLHHG